MSGKMDEISTIRLLTDFCKILDKFVTNDSEVQNSD